MSNMPIYDPNQRDPSLCIVLKTGSGDSLEVRRLALKEKYREQDKRHVTVLSDSKLKEIFKHTSLGVGELRQKIQEIAKKYDWGYTETDIYHIEKNGPEDRPEVMEHRESYIRAIHMPDMEKFYKDLDKTFGTELPVQFPHITLFTKGETKNPRYYGIGISSTEKFKTLNPIKIS